MNFLEGENEQAKTALAAALDDAAEAREQLALAQGDATDVDNHLAQAVEAGAKLEMAQGDAQRAGAALAEAYRDMEHGALALAEARAEMDEMRARLAELTVARDAGLAEARAELDALRARLAELPEARAAAQRMAVERDQANNERHQLLREREEIMASTTWRLGRLIVAAPAVLPASVRFQARRAFKLAYWLVTPWRTSERMRILRERRTLSEPPPVAVAPPYVLPDPSPPPEMPTPQSPAPAPAAVATIVVEAPRTPQVPVDRAVWNDTMPPQLLREGGVGQERQPAPHGLRAEARLVAESPLFDAEWYLARYPDVADSGLHPATHYVERGVAEGRDPGPRLSTQAYLELYPDVAAARVNPLVHYLQYGIFEGRTFRSAEASPPPPPGDFSVVYVSGEPDTPGNHYRVLRYGAAVINSGGGQASWMRAADVGSRLADFETADLLVIWRALWSPEIATAIGIMRARGKRVVFDVDDLMTEPDLASTDIIDGIRSQNLTEETTRSHYASVRKTMMASDFCFAPTEELAFYLRGSGKPTYVLPNGFDQATLGKARRALRTRRSGPSDGLVRIGYAGGSRTHQRDLGLAIEALAKVMRERPQCRLVLFRTPDNTTPLIDVEEYPAFVGLEDRIEWRHLQPIHELPNELARFDINLAPLEFGNAFCEAKSELKFFESALVETPTVASPTGPFSRAIDHGKTGFLAATAEEWYAHLIQLVDDADLRARIGRQAYHAALARFGPLQRTETMGRVVSQFQGGQRAAHAWALEALCSRPTLSS